MAVTYIHKHMLIFITAYFNPEGLYKIRTAVSMKFINTAVLICMIDTL